MNLLLGTIILYLVLRVAVWAHHTILFPGKAYLIKAIDLEGKRIYVEEIR